MKKPLLFVASAGLVLLCAATFLFREKPPTREETVPEKIITATPDGGTLAVSQDAKEIFRRAFWRRPTDGDRILHAERREWADADEDVQRWQWFLALEPGEGLMRDLRDENRFALAPVTSPATWPDPAAVPAWFPPVSQLADFEILQNPSGQLTILRHREKNLIFATDNGRGFAAPVRPVR